MEMGIGEGRADDPVAPAEQAAEVARHLVADLGDPPGNTCCGRINADPAELAAGRGR